MNLRNINKNATELKLNDFYILYSYTTPVVVIDRSTNKALVTNQFYSQTTNKHIAAYLKEKNPSETVEVYQDVISLLLENKDGK